MGLAPTSICEYGKLHQTAFCLILKCPLHCAIDDTMDTITSSWITRVDAGSTTPLPTFEDDLP